MKNGWVREGTSTNCLTSTRLEVAMFHTFMALQVTYTQSVTSTYTIATTVGFSISVSLPAAVLR